MNTKISVIIPTYCSKSRHDSSRLYLSLLGFTKQTLDKNLYEIIVVDDGSEWDIQNLIKNWNLNCDVRVIRQLHQGMCTAYKTGINMAKGDYIFLGIDDNIPSPSLLNEHLNDLLHEKDRIVWGREYHMRQMKKIFNPITGESIQKELPSQYVDSCAINIDDVVSNFEGIVKKAMLTEKYKDMEYTLENFNLKNLRSPWLVMRVGNQSLSKDLLEKSGGIDEKFNPSGWYMDLELGLRLLKKNAKFKLNLRAEMIHLSHEREPIALKDEAEKHEYFFKKHPSLSVALIPFFFKSNIGILEYSTLIKRIEDFKYKGVFNE